MTASARRAAAAIAAVAALAMLGGGGAASAAIPAGNLVKNPGAEDGTGAANVSDAPPVPSWTTASGFTAVQYGVDTFPGTDEAGRIGGGRNFFAGGPDNAGSSATQTIDLAAAAAEIDAGQAKAALSADLGGWQGQDDSGVVDALFLDATGKELGRLSIGPVTAADRLSETKLLPRSTDGTVPAGSRSIRVAMTATRSAGAYNDGYFDNLSLTIAEIPAAPLKPGRCANRKAGTDGDDTIEGTDRGDRIDGRKGNDLIKGLFGHDCLLGFEGNDRLEGGGGNDELQGGLGNDRAYGGDGKDKLFGGAGNDRLFGEGGDDRLSGGAGRDRMFGGAGNDRVYGGAGNDRLSAGKGRNRISGGPGDDAITANNGQRDIVFCGEGNDRGLADDEDKLLSCERFKVF